MLRVKVTGRLVRKDQLGSCHHGTRDRHPLLLSSGELLREVLRPVADVHAFEYLCDFLFPLRCADVEVAQRKFDILIDIEFVDEVEALEHESDVSLAELRAVLLLEFRHLVAEEFVTAAGRVVEQAEDVQQGGLPAP